MLHRLPYMPRLLLPLLPSRPPPYTISLPTHYHHQSLSITTTTDLPDEEEPHRSRYIHADNAPHTHATLKNTNHVYRLPPPSLVSSPPIGFPVLLFPLPAPRIPLIQRRRFTFTSIDSKIEREKSEEKIRRVKISLSRIELRTSFFKLFKPLIPLFICYSLIGPLCFWLCPVLSCLVSTGLVFGSC